MILRSQVIIFKINCIFSFMIDLVLANSVDPCEMPHHVALLVCKSNSLGAFALQMVNVMFWDYMVPFYGGQKAAVLISL